MCASTCQNYDTQSFPSKNTLLRLNVYIHTCMGDDEEIFIMSDKTRFF